MKKIHINFGYINFCFLLFLFLQVVLEYSYCQESENSGKLSQHNSVNPDTKTDKYFNSQEVFILQNLSERRKILEVQEKKIQDQQKFLSAIEKNIEQKIKSLEGLQKKITKIQKQEELEEKEKIKRFIKIYENMPPKSVSKIFDDMELELLVKIIGAMREVKASAILAHMDVKKSREISVILANNIFYKNVQNDKN